jgi:hypothetical protein
MYEQEDDYAEEGEDSEEISNEIWQEACWIVISAYFDEKGISCARTQCFLLYRSVIVENDLILIYMSISASSS